MKRLRLPLAVSLATVAFASQAADAYLADKTSASVNWRDASKWVDSQGNALAAAPTTSVDTAYIVDDGMSVRRRKLTFGGSSGKGTLPDYTIGAVCGSYLNTIAWQDYYHNATGNHQPAYTLTLLNPNGFEGFWETLGASAVFELPAANGFVPRLSHLSSRRCPRVKVSSDGGTGEVGDIYGCGAVEKTGPGTLLVESASSGRARLYVREGGLSLKGRPTSGSSLVDAILAKAMLHLDASVESSLVKGMDKDGRVTVERWNDVRGAGRPHAFVPTDQELVTQRSSAVRHANAPFVNGNATPTGLPVVDFGAGKVADFEKLGPTNCFMKFSEELAGVREVVYAISRPDGLNYVPVLGSVDEEYYPFYPSGANLFYERHASPDVYMGDVRVDGEHVVNNVYTYAADFRSRMHVVGVGTTNAVHALALACERRIPEKVGGIRIGEVLVFDEPLTVEERTAIDGYLVAKWEDSSVERDVSAVFLSDGTKIDVPAGRTATVSQLVVGTNSVEKTGGGTLRIGRLYGGESFSVKEGAVEFSGHERIPADAPAADPWLWLDATDGTSIVGGADGITRWNDTRNGSVESATNYAVTTHTVLPKLVENGCGTLPVVDFGTQNEGTWMDFSKTGVDYAKSVFMVVRLKVTGKQNLLGSSNAEGRRTSDTSTALLTSDGYMNPKMYAAQWTVNGKPADPRLPCDVLAQTDDFFVLGFSAAEAVRVDKLFRDQNASGADRKGCCQLGEYLLYDRLLSEDEKRRTTAYLMNRWLGKAHPENDGSSSVKEMTVSDDSPIVIDTDCDIAIGAVAGGNGTFSKSGAGEVTVLSASTNSAKSISVSGGALALNLRLPLENEALFHFDASDRETLTLVEGVDVDGNPVTNVTHWADARRNGIVATSTRIWAPAHPSASWRYAAMAVADPVFVNAETATGVVRPAVNFGDPRNSSNGTPEGCKANAASFMLPETYEVKEIFTVYADTGSNSTRGFIVGVNNTDWMRNSAAIISSNYTSNDAKNGYHAVDGAYVAYSTYLTHGQFYVVSFGTKYGNVDGSPILIDAICQDRVSNAGGGTVCEQIAFGRTLSPDERDEMEEYLKSKWLGKAKSPYSAANMVFGIVFDESGVPGRVDINDVVDFSDGASFLLSAADVSAIPRSGRWPVLGCIDAVGWDVSRVSLESGFSRRRTASLSMERGTVYLSIGSFGNVIIVR